MAKKLDTSEKIGIVIGVLILLGGGSFLIYRKLTKNKRECEAKGGTWDKETKSCKLPVKKEPEIAQKTQDNLTFQSGKSIIKSSSYPTLIELADYLKTIPALELTLEGHTDSQGDEDYNLQLSKGRANAVKLYLTQKGVEQNRIKAKGYGETKPIADNNTRQGREKNRRVEFKIA
jgi:outer membrane protein OmpA-like peptidoglycan-associated protein